MFFMMDIIFVLYVDDGIIFTREAGKFSWIFGKLKQEFDIEEKGDVQQFLGMNFTKEKEKIMIIQPHLINQIIEDVGLDKVQCKCPDIPMKSSQILQRNQEEPVHDETAFHYRSVIGKIELFREV